MNTSTGIDLACFGYLAFAQATAVAAYPAANSGAQVDQVFPSLAGDAPLCALTAKSLGVSAHLVSNRVSLDPAGQTVLDTLDTAGVAHHAMPTETGGPGTPQLTIVTDQAGTRTWFAWLGNAVDQLATADLTPLTAARLVYIDCYRLIDSAATAAITATRAPLLLNLGGDPLSDAIANAAAQRHIAFVQTNLDEHAAEHAETLAAQLFDRLNPGELTAAVIDDPHLAGLCEHYDILDKIVLHDDPDGWRLRLHVFLDGYFDRPHNHRWTYTSHILTGSYIHTLYGTDHDFTDSIDVSALTPRLVRIEEPGDVYTLHHSMIHSVTAHGEAVTLVVRGPAVKERFVVTDRATGKAWWQYGASTEPAEAAAAKRMSVNQLRDRVAALGTSGVFSHR